MKKTGFTLTEMLITLTILAILLGIAAPSFQESLKNSSMLSNANGMITAFNYARMEATKRGDRVYVGQVKNNWTDGIVVWVDNDEVGSTAGSFDSGEELRLWPAFENESSVSSAKSTFYFRGTGEVDSADVLRVCDDRTGEQGMQITILESGAVIPEKVTCG